MPHAYIIWKTIDLNPIVIAKYFYKIGRHQGTSF